MARRTGCVVTHERLVPLQEQRKAFQEMWLGFLKHKVESGGWKCRFWCGEWGQEKLLP